MINLRKKAQFESYLVDIIFWLVVLVVVLLIIWELYTGKMTELWKSLVEKMRFM